MKNNLKNKVRNCEKICGTHIALSDSTVVEILGKAGYDFLWIDTEHAGIDDKDLLQHLRTACMTGTPAIVRTSVKDLTRTKHILEMGPEGIIFPMISTAEEADAAMRICMYPPKGNRGFGPLRSMEYGMRDMTDYMNNIDNELCRFIQIESREAVRNLPEIVKNPYIDGYIFGPCDLSGSIGHLGDVFCPENVSLMKEAIHILKNEGKSIGISYGSVQDPSIPAAWDAMGINMISLSGDFSYLLQGSRDNLSLIRQVQGNNQ